MSFFAREGSSAHPWSTAPPGCGRCRGRGMPAMEARYCGGLPTAAAFMRHPDRKKRCAGFAPGSSRKKAPWGLHQFGPGARRWAGRPPRPVRWRRWSSSRKPCWRRYIGRPSPNRPSGPHTPARCRGRRRRPVCPTEWGALTYRRAAGRQDSGRCACGAISSGVPSRDTLAMQLTSPQAPRP